MSRLDRSPSVELGSVQGEVPQLSNFRQNKFASGFNWFLCPMFKVEFSGDQFEEYEQLKVVYSSVKVIKSEESIERMREGGGSTLISR